VAILRLKRTCAQLFGYVRGSRIEHALLIDYGGEKFQIRKFILSTDEPIDEYEEA
jgi:hypothetical protein